MKKFVGGIVVIVVLVGGYFLTSHLTGGSLPTLGLPLGGESAVVRERALGFVEDLHFKDLRQAATVFEPNSQSTQNVRNFLERFFEVKTEHLDIIKYSVSHVEMDSTKKRARVGLNIKAKNLLSSEEMDRELLLFFYHSESDLKWYMSLPDM